MGALIVSLTLLAVGMLLTFTGLDSTNIRIDTIGVILLLVGIGGMILSLLFWVPFAPLKRIDGDR